MHDLFMQQAIREAKKAARKNEVPIGAILVCEDKIVARGYNTCEKDQSPIRHAEIKVIQKACKLKNNWRLNDCDLYVTLEPCPMCLGALFQARLKRLFFGASDHKRRHDLHSNKGALSVFPSLEGVKSLKDNNHKLEVHGGVMAEECSKLLKEFFRGRREKG